MSRMKPVRVYGYQGCSTCRKAYAFLKARDRPFVEVDITTTPPSPAELAAMLRAVDGNIRKLFNTSGLVYREQKLSARLPQLTEAAALALLAGNGRLVKRPFLVVGAAPVAVGFDPEAWADALE